jgi:hypothetical protein
MRLTSRFALAAAALLVSTTLRADTPATTQWVVTSAHASGGGNDYVTGLRIVNPNPAAATVDMYLLPASDGSGDNSGAGKVTVTVPANATLAIDDVLSTKFGTVGAGGIRVESTGTTQQPVWVLSQTLVVNARSSTGVPGTNGFAIPAQNTEQLVALGETAYVPYVSSSSSGSSGYRTNLFLLSASGTGSTVVTVTLLKGDGTVLGTRDVTLAKYAQTQINGIAASFGYTANDTNLTATVKVKSGGPVATGASVIDNAIASISYSPPVKVAIANNGAFGILLNDPYGAGGRLDVIDGNGDFVYTTMVVENCAGGPTGFSFQAFGPSFGPSLQNTSFVRNPTDGTITFSGADPNSTFSGTILSRYDGSIQGTITYTRAAGSAGAPCGGATATYAYRGAKVFKLP